MKRAPWWRGMAGNGEINSIRGILGLNLCRVA